MGPGTEAMLEVDLQTQMFIQYVCLYSISIHFVCAYTVFTRKSHLSSVKSRLHSILIVTTSHDFSRLFCVFDIGLMARAGSYLL